MSRLLRNCHPIFRRVHKLSFPSSFQVDESLLSASEAGGEDHLHHHHGGRLSGGGDKQQGASSSSYPWVQMALPGGGIVSVPLASAEASSVGSGNRALSPESGGLAGSGDRRTGEAGVSSSAPTTLRSGGLPGGGVGGIPASSSSSALPGGAAKGDLLTVNAGEPVTHFNLDQLLEIVQSFQLDTTMAGHEEGEQAARLNLVLAAAAANSAANSSIQVRKCFPVASIRKYVLFFKKNLFQNTQDGKDLDSCDGLQNCDKPKSSSAIGESCASNGGGGSSLLPHPPSFSLGPVSSSTSNLHSATGGGAGGGAGGASNPGGLTLPLQQQQHSHSCPSSPTETDCSSGFSTLRRRSVTLTEKVREGSGVE